MRRFLFVPFLVFFVFAIFFPPSQTVFGQSGSAYDLIAAVNALRASNGMQAYETDSGLMASAQQHAEYMATTGNITHTREDGSTPSSLGFIENIAGGYNLTVSVTIYSMWTDTDHWNTMAGITYGKVGAGVAEKDGYIYYVLQVQRITTGLAGQPTANYNSTADPNVVSPVITNTPQLDGSIIHEVLDGQSLWSIATTYNVTIEEIIAWNSLQPTPVIFPGDHLLVRLAPTATTTPTVTLTPVPPTRTITPTVTPKTPTVTPTITPTRTATPRVLFSIEKVDPGQRKWMGIGMVIICGIGLLAISFFGFLKKER
jgi:uncharacterized protein YkwD